MITGPDVSAYQPDWKPSDKDSFCFIKSTEGHTWTNRYRDKQSSAARAKGLQVGWYSFLWPGSGKLQADWFTSKTDIRAGDLLVCDFENTKGGHPSAADAAAFIDEVKRLRPNNKIGLYCNLSDLSKYHPKTGDFLWIATWGTSTAPTTTPAWTFWQYTDQPLDQNRAKFDTLAELKAWAGGQAPQPTGYPTPKTSDVYLSKLKLGQQNSDSVWQFQKAIKILGGQVELNGDFSKANLAELAAAVFDKAGMQVTIHNDL